MNKAVPALAWIKALVPKPLQSSLQVSTKLFGTLNLGNSAENTLLLFNTDYQLVLYTTEKKLNFFVQ